MCNFLSAIAFKNGDVFEASQYTDSHEHLIASLGLDDTKDLFIRNWVRVEFVPGNDVADVDKYTLRCDECESPAWWDGVSETVEKNLHRIVSKMVIRDERKCILGGCWIFAGARSNHVVSARIIAMLGSSQVNEMLGSSQVKTMRDSSQVNEMLDSSQVNEMLDSSQVNEMRGSSQVKTMWGSSQVNEMWGSSQVKTMRDSSQVNEMRGSSKSSRNPVSDNR